MLHSRAIGRLGLGHVARLRLADIRWCLLRDREIGAPEPNNACGNWGTHVGAVGAAIAANPCSLVAPCRLLPAALAAVADGGEVWILDSANYNTGPVFVTKSVTILAVPGALGSVVSIYSGNAINIATPGVKVRLRNLMIGSYFGPSQGSGVYMTAGNALTIRKLPVHRTGIHGACNLGSHRRHRASDGHNDSRQCKRWSDYWKWRACFRGPGNDQRERRPWGKCASVLSS